MSLHEGEEFLDKLGIRAKFDEQISSIENTHGPEAANLARVLLVAFGRNTKNDVALRNTLLREIEIGQVSFKTGLAFPTFTWIDRENLRFLFEPIEKCELPVDSIFPIGEIPIRDSDLLVDIVYAASWLHIAMGNGPVLQWREEDPKEQRFVPEFLVIRGHLARVTYEVGQILF